MLYEQLSNIFDGMYIMQWGHNALAGAQFPRKEQSQRCSTFLKHMAMNKINIYVKINNHGEEGNIIKMIMKK